MAELLIFAVVLVIVALAMWLVVAGDREQDFTDEKPTLDVQNRKDEDQ